MAARTVITSFILLAPCRVRVAGALDKNDEGQCAFVAGGKVYDNSKYDSSWHTFPEGTKFELAAIVDKTDTYCLLAKEKISEVRTNDEGEEYKVSKTELNGVFVRRKSWEKLLAAAGDQVAETPEPEDKVEFGTDLADVTEPEPEPEVNEDDELLDELVAEVEELDRIEDEGPSFEELAEIEATLAELEENAA